MRASEFIIEGTNGRSVTRAKPNHEFERAHPGMIGPSNQGDVYFGRYYDFYRISSLAGVDIDKLNSTDDISFFSNFPIFSAYTEHDRKKLLAIMKKLKMDPKIHIGKGSLEPKDVNATSPINAFRGYKR